MNHKAIVFGVVLAAILPFVSAVNCWQEHQMPLGNWTYSAWLCNSTQVGGWYTTISEGDSHPFYTMLRGSIVTTAPPGHIEAGQKWKVQLFDFQYSSPYPATLRCYKYINNRYVYTGVQITLVDGNVTQDGTQWIEAGCPPIANFGHAGSPPQVHIAVNWGGFRKGG